MHRNQITLGAVPSRSCAFDKGVSWKAARLIGILVLKRSPLMCLIAVIYAWRGEANRLSRINMSAVWNQYHCSIALNVCRQTVHAPALRDSMMRLWLY